MNSSFELPLHAGLRLESAIRLTPLPNNAIKILAEPQSVKRMALPLLMDDGTVRVFIGWRVIYSNCLGPTKGGVRFHPATNEAELTQLAFRILLKCAVNDLPHGGAGGGIAVDPRLLSKNEKEKLARAYVNALGDEIGPDVDILSPDLGTNAEVMSWMMDQYNKSHRAYIPAAINGKPIAAGGILGRSEATSLGAWTVLNKVLADREIQAHGLTFSIQGYGSAGGNFARLLQQNGLRMIAVSDSSGGLFAPGGLDTEAIWRCKQQGQSISEIKIADASAITSQEVLTVKADIIIPAATANQITKEISPRLNCRMIVEIANSPIEFEAEAEILEKGIEIIPDIVVNAGGITVSHFEWSQNRSGLLWTIEETYSRLCTKISGTTERMLQVAVEQDVSLPIAAQLLALKRLAPALSI
jgi:glutamate dehydrogenase (NADP+)